jgi:hypothetical protein
MNATTTANTRAKNAFQVVLADSNARVLEQHRLTRAQFERFFDNRKVARMVMEACELRTSTSLASEQRAARLRAWDSAVAASTGGLSRSDLLSQAARSDPR